MIPVTKAYLPRRSQLERQLDKIYQTGRLTNQGPLVDELTRRLEAYLGVENLLLVANGTLALQIAFRALGIHGEAVTTPFSFVATASSLRWEGIRPVFSDIDPHTFCLDPRLVERAITAKTTALVPVHVFGNGCEVEPLDAIARAHGLKVVYDGAHAFGVRYKQHSLLRYGDATTLSFHATKLFHTIEGGAIVFRDRRIFEEAKRMIAFGLTGEDSITSLGINAKMNELQAAMGLCVLDEVADIIRQRKAIYEQLERHLGGGGQLQARNPHCDNNFAYFPIVFPTEGLLLEAKRNFNQAGIFPRRYFYPSLDSLPYLQPQESQPVSQDIASRIMCLPLYPGMTESDIKRVLDVLTPFLSANAP